MFTEFFGTFSVVRHLLYHNNSLPFEILHLGINVSKTHSPEEDTQSLGNQDIIENIESCLKVSKTNSCSVQMCSPKNNNFRKSSLKYDRDCVRAVLEPSYQI
jgi:hypothetical protein